MTIVDEINENLLRSLVSLRILKGARCPWNWTQLPEGLCAQYFAELTRVSPDDCNLTLIVTKAVESLSELAGVSKLLREKLALKMCRLAMRENGAEQMCAQSAWPLGTRRNPDATKSDLLVACMCAERHDLLPVLMNGTDLNAKSSLFGRPIQVAAFLGCATSFKQLVDAGVQLDLTHRSSAPGVLPYWCERKERGGIGTPLVALVAGGHLDILKEHLYQFLYFQEHGIDRSIEYTDATLMAARRGHMRTATFLRRNAPRTVKKSELKHRCLRHAILGYRLDPDGQMLQIKRLLAENANANYFTEGNVTMGSAIIHADPKVVATLLQHKSLSNKRLEVCFRIAGGRNRLDMLGMLRQLAGQESEEDMLAATVVSACGNGHLDVIEYYIRCGYDLHHTRERLLKIDGTTQSTRVAFNLSVEAMGAALLRGFDHIAEFLFKKGVNPLDSVELWRRQAELSPCSNVAYEQPRLTLNAEKFLKCQDAFIFQLDTIVTQKDL